MNPLKRLREDLKLNQTEFGKLAGVCQQQVSKWERAPEFYSLRKESQKAIRGALGLTWIDMEFERRKDVEAAQRQGDSDE